MTPTNDLLYESNDSRDIGKASISDSLPNEVPDGFERRGQKPFFSGGEGLNKSAHGCWLAFGDL
jgi:hypothetical protein